MSRKASRIFAEPPPDYVAIALSDQIVTRCGTADYASKETGAVHRDLRRALKASAMKFRIPTPGRTRRLPLGNRVPRAALRPDGA
ncbi:hypothetical protein [Streptomyces sp. NPDC004629]|uniref:hypothetical protein n=1 Tax=Streptomyces sp. NPDC004629 TaxID=3364705 RepID=UPI0036767D08